ncbi:MAG: sulfatase [Deltaproteobacteria bacterium]|nr:sulfatase [Deltaproteobacteria bacterium]
MRQSLLWLMVFAGVARGATHPVFDLVHNRPLSHQGVRGGLFVEAGTAGFAKYVHFGRPRLDWTLQQTEAGVGVARVKGAGALLVPLTAEQAASGVVAVRLKTGKAGRLGVVVSKQKAVAEVAVGWNLAVVKLPAGALRAGENRLELDVPGEVAVHWLQIGGEAPGSADAGAPVEGLSPGGGVAWYVMVPMGGALETTLTGEAGCKPWVKVTGTGAPALTVPLRLGASAVPLGVVGGKTVRLELGVTGCARVGIAAAALTVPGAAPVRTAVKPPKRVIIWLTDNTRADKVGTFNPKARARTPVMDGLAKTGVLFANAYANGNESRLSHASLWTAMYPAAHGMISSTAVLPARHVTMAEAVKPSGLQTVGTSGNGYIIKRWGFGDGWDVFKNNLHQGGGLKGEDLVATALKLMEKRWDKPFFLYVGTIDAHTSWKAHEPWLSQYDKEHGPYTGKYKTIFRDGENSAISAGKVKIDARDKQRIVSLYDADISYNDQQLGVLLGELDKRGLRDDTMVIVCADHGEEFWEHGKIGHGQSSREELTHIPLLISYPGAFAPAVIDEPVELMDVMPTVVEALGLAQPPEWQGMSLVGLMQGVGRGYPTAAVTTQYDFAHSMRVGRWKLRVGGKGDSQLHDIPSDPFEMKDVVDQEPEARRLMTDAMSLYLVRRKQWKRGVWGTPSNLTARFGE